MRLSLLKAAEYERSLSVVIDAGSQFRIIVNAFREVERGTDVSAIRKHKVDQHTVLVDSAYTCP